MATDSITAEWAWGEDKTRRSTVDMASKTASFSPCPLCVCCVGLILSVRIETVARVATAFVIRPISQTYPAEVMLALWARHAIAPGVLLDAHIAIRTGFRVGEYPVLRCVVQRRLHYGHDVRSG